MQAAVPTTPKYKAAIEKWFAALSRGVQLTTLIDKGSAVAPKEFDASLSAHLPRMGTTS